MRLRITLCVVFVCFVALYSVAAPPSPFLGKWDTRWTRVDYVGVKDGQGNLIDKAPSEVVVVEDTPNTNILDGTWTSTDPKTKAVASGQMHGTLSPDGQQWSGVWWGKGVNEHGNFTFTLKSATTFTGSFTAAKHGATTYSWNGAKVK